MNLRDRCEKLFWQVRFNGSSREKDIDMLEYFACEIRNEALEEAANVLGDYEQGTLEQVNSGDATLMEIRGEIKLLQSIAKSIIKLKHHAEKENKNA